MSECPHSLAERETAVADGMCPLCMSALHESMMAAVVRRQERIAELEAELDAIRARTVEECLTKLPEDTPAYVCATILALAQTG